MQTESTSQTVKSSHQCDSLDHVLDMAANSADCGQLLPVTPPLVHTELGETTQQYRLLNGTNKRTVFQHSIAKILLLVYKILYTFWVLVVHLIVMFFLAVQGLFWLYNLL